ncbi:MAG: SPASM domain-containing protein [Flavobacteriales bacterium]|nr:SPASM domain-containing protein [Flavobacteriales bacterium]
MLLYTSYLLSRWFRRSIHWGMPMSIAIEPTTACNLGCPECPSGLKKFTRPTGNLLEEQFQSVLSQLKNRLFNVTFYFQGEPFIHRGFLDLVKMASDHGVYSSTSTNAHFITPAKAKEAVESGLGQMIISIDGTTQEVYEQYRVHGSLEKVLEGTRNMVVAKKELNSSTPKLIFQFLVVKPNEHQIDDAKKLAEEMGVDEIRFKTAQLYDYENGNPLMPTLDHYRRYRQLSNGKWAIKNKLENHCWRMWHSCVITWDGKLVPCCFDKDAHFTLGQMEDGTDFRKIWKGQSYQQFRQAVLTGRDQIEICRNCTEGTLVWGSDS